MVYTKEYCYTRWGHPVFQHVCQEQLPTVKIPQLEASKNLYIQAVQITRYLRN